MADRIEQHTAKSTYKKLAVHWFSDALCFVSSSVLADSFRLRNRQLHVAANHYNIPQIYSTLPAINYLFLNRGIN